LIGEKAMSVDLLALVEHRKVAASRGQAAHPSTLGQVRAAVEDPAHVDEPRHVRLRAALLDALAAGHWSPGDKLPPEREIALSVGLSLGTVQKALARLASERVLVRRHGHGTFVSGDASQSDQLLHFRFVGDDGTAVVPVYAEAIERTVLHMRGAWSQFLRAQSCIRIRRRINVASEFDCLSEYYIDAERFRPILDLPFRELHRVVIRNLLARHFNAPTFSFTQRIHSTMFSDAVRAILKLTKQNGFGMVLEIFSYTHHRAPISFQSIYIPAATRRLEIPSMTVGK